MAYRLETPSDLASRGSGRPVCRLPARSAFGMPTKRHGASSSGASNALLTLLSCPCSLTGIAASAISTMRAFLARKLRQAGAAGVCLEDSCFPKLNSLIGERHPLAVIDEFFGRLRAVKDVAAKLLFSSPGPKR